ncbi:hypothetical protein JCM12294_03410 [Desulfocicer niacini]
MTNMETSAQRGFTLMEILVAVVIFAILMTTVLSSFKAFVMSSDHIRTAISRDEAMGPPLGILSRDLMYLHLSLPPSYIKPDTRSNPDPFRLVGDSKTVGGETFSRVRFVSRGLLTARGKEQDQLVQVIYYARSNDTGGVDLCRSENVFPWTEDAENDCDPVLVRDINAFELTFFDSDGETFIHWDSDAEAFDRATPSSMKVLIRFKGPHVREEDSQTGETLMTSILLPIRRKPLE